jgi:hypothetical protein
MEATAEQTENWVNMAVTKKRSKKRTMGTSKPRVAKLRQPPRLKRLKRRKK